MEIQVIVALAVAIPVILFPAAFIWYINISGVYSAMKEWNRQRNIRKVRPRASC